MTKTLIAGQIEGIALATGERLTVTVATDGAARIDRLPVGGGAAIFAGSAVTDAEPASYGPFNEPAYFRVWCDEVSLTIDASVPADTGAALVGTAETKPAASAAVRGQFWLDKGASGNIDTLQVCLKGDDDSYTWVDVASGVTAPSG